MAASGSEDWKKDKTDGLEDISIEAFYEVQKRLVYAIMVSDAPGKTFLRVIKDFRPKYISECAWMSCSVNAAIGAYVDSDGVFRRALDLDCLDTETRIGMSYVAGVDFIMRAGVWNSYYSSFARSIDSVKQ